MTKKIYPVILGILFIIILILLLRNFSFSGQVTETEIQTESAADTEEPANESEDERETESAWETEELTENTAAENAEKKEKTPGLVECISAKDLSETAGFEILDITYIPYRVLETDYLWKNGETAQIEYIGEEQSITYRKTFGEPEIVDAEDYEYAEYAEITNISLHEVPLTLKGENEKYTLVVWQNGGYFYSMHFAVGLDVDSICRIFVSLRS